MRIVAALALLLLQSCMQSTEESSNSLSMRANAADCDSNCFGYNELKSMRCDIEEDSAVCKATLKAAPDTAVLNKIANTKQAMTCEWLLEIDYKRDKGLDYSVGIIYQGGSEEPMRSFMPFEMTSLTLEEDVRIGDSQEDPLSSDTQLLNDTLIFKVRRANCISLVSLFNNSNVFFHTYSEEGNHGQTRLSLLRK